MVVFDIWMRPSVFPELRLGQVHVWRVWTDRDPRGGLDLLSAEERRRADAFRTETLRARFVASHVALRQLLGRYLGVAAAQLDFGQNAWGKPELSGGGLRFNLSHSGVLALVAVARNAEIGVDVETISHPPPLDVAGIAYSPIEREALALLSGRDLTAAFYAVWTRKEALSKGVGRGFSFDFPSFSVSTDPATRISRPLLPPDIATGADWHVVDLPPVAGAAAAVAVPRGGFEIASWAFESWA